MTFSVLATSRSGARIWVQEQVTGGLGTGLGEGGGTGCGGEGAAARATALGELGGLGF